MKRKSRGLQKDKSHNITNEGEFYDKNSPSLAFLCRNQEVDDFLNYCYFIRTHWRIHQPAIDTYQGMGSLLYLHLAGSVRMHTLMIQELSLHKKINTLEKLGHLWMIHH